MVEQRVRFTYPSYVITPGGSFDKNPFRGFQTSRLNRLSGQAFLLRRGDDLQGVHLLIAENRHGYNVESKHQMDHQMDDTMAPKRPLLSSRFVAQKAVDFSGSASRVSEAYGASEVLGEIRKS